MSRYIAPWRRSLRPASFRGVSFYVKTSQTQVGRRVALHEYPQRDEAYPEDLGLKADQFTIEAIVIGPDYFKARDALIAALKQRGAGTLIHPYYGKRTVTLISPARISETPDEGGMARFSLDFVEAGENAEPSQREDTQGAAETAADDANTAIAEDFESIYTLDDVPDFVESGALSVARDAMSALENARRMLVPNIGILADYTAAVSGVVGSLNNLIRAPAAYAQGVLGLVGTLKALAKSPATALLSYRSLFSYGNDLPSIARTTASRKCQARNQAAQGCLIRRAALIEGARVACRIDYDTYDTAVATRDELAALLDDEAAGIVPTADTPQEVSEAVYQALTTLRVALVRDLSTRSVDAPHLSSVTLPATLPALVAAYRVFGDATQAEALVTRNSRLIRHPGFVPGGTALEIIVE